MGKGIFLLSVIMAIIGFPGLVLYLLAPPWWTWTHIPLDEWVQWVGVAVSIAPLFYLVWVHRHLDRQWSIALEIQEEHKLITTGPYKRVRHPMYLGIFVYTIGLCIVSLDVLVILFFVFSIWVNYRRIPNEEQMMIDQFGDEYTEYMQHTGRLLPKFWIEKSVMPRRARVDMGVKQLRLVHVRSYLFEHLQGMWWILLHSRRHCCDKVGGRPSCRCWISE